MAIPTHCSVNTIRRLRRWANARGEGARPSLAVVRSRTVDSQSSSPDGRNQTENKQPRTQTHLSERRNNATWSRRGVLLHTSRERSGSLAAHQRRDGNPRPPSVAFLPPTAPPPPAAPADCHLCLPTTPERFRSPVLTITTLQRGTVLVARPAAAGAATSGESRPRDGEVRAVQPFPGRTGAADKPPTAAVSDG